jgi:dihydroorotate dehydrogenase (NAD+) catalytic subunit
MQFDQDGARTIVRELRKVYRSNAALAGKLGVSENTASKWQRHDGQEQIEAGNVHRIVSLAASEGIPVEQFASVRPLWNWDASYAQNVDYVPDPPPKASQPMFSHDHRILGREIASPFGVSASILTCTPPRIGWFANSGCDILTFKTVRSRQYESLRPPNVFFLAENTPVFEPNGSLPDFVIAGPSSDGYQSSTGAINRFNMPSPAPEVWSAWFKQAQSLLQPNQLLILSVYGSAYDSSDPEALIQDFGRVVELGVSAGAEAIELNLSCPNCAGREGEIFHDLELCIRICTHVRNVAPHTQLIAKLGYLDRDELVEFVRATAPYLNGYAAINTIAVESRSFEQGRLVPTWHVPDLKAGLSGSRLLRLGLQATRTIRKVLDENGYEDHAIIGIGGVSGPGDVDAYLGSGASAVQATTKFFSDPLFGFRVRRHLDKARGIAGLSHDAQAELGHRNLLRAAARLRTKGVDVRDQTIDRELRRWLSEHEVAAGMGVMRKGTYSVEHFERVLMGYR